MSRKMMWTTVITAVVVAALIAMVFVSGRKSATPPEEQKGTELVEMVPAKGKTGESVAEEVPTAEETGVDSSDQYEFLLVDHNDYVAVYQLPERENLRIYGCDYGSSSRRRAKGSTTWKIH